MNSINPYDEVLLVVDQDQRFKYAQEQRKKIDPDREAETINTLVKVLGRRSIRFALVSEHDERGLKAYHKTGFEVVRVNGNRSGEVNRFIAQHSELLKSGRIGHLVLVTTDSTFAFMANQADPRNTQISVWAPSTSLSREITATMPPCEFRDLDEMLPASPKVVVLIDFENIWYGLKKVGKTPEPKVLIDAIRDISAEFGEIKKLTAYADWELMSKERQGNIQRELVQLDVDTQYLINIRGKNTADMRVANDIRDIIEKGNGLREDADVIILATGDRDFRDIVKTAKDRGKRVVILAVRNGVSRDLVNVASEVRYIDEIMHITPKYRSNKYTVRPWSELTPEVAKLTSQAKAWIPLCDLPALGIEDVEKFMRQATSLQLVKGEFGTGTDGVTKDGLRLNAENFVVKVVSRLTKWVPDRIAHCLIQKGMPYVDSAYIAKGMAMDRTLQEWGVGQERSEVDKWLELLDNAGVIKKKIQPHPVSIDRQIATWWLPEGCIAGDTDLTLHEMPQEPSNELQHLTTSQASLSNKTKSENSNGKESLGSLWQSVLGSPA